MTPCIVVRRSVYEELGGFDDRLACAEDWEMWVRVAARFPVYYEERPLACYRLHDDSNTGRNLRSGLNLEYTRRAIEIFADVLRADRKACRQTNRLLALRHVGTRDRARPAVQGRRRRGARTAAGRLEAREVTADRCRDRPRGRRLARTPRRQRIAGGAMRPGDARAPWTPPVNLVLVGCGAVARSYYAPALTRLLAGGWIGAVRLFDPSSARAREVAALLPAGAVAPSWDDALNGAEELAIVASPPVAHAEQVRALLEHGKHVLCEKPFVLDRAAGESLADLARERGLLCAAGMVRRFSRSACLLRQLLSEERPTRLVWHEGNPFRWPVDSPAYFAPEAGNQLLWDIGSHVVDLLVWWLGVPHELACRDDAMGGTATNCLLELEWPDGCSAEVRLSREYDLPSGLVVERPSGVLSCRDVAEMDVLRAAGEAAAPDFEQRIPGAAAPAGRIFADCFELQLQNVLAAVRGVAPLWAPAEDVLESVGALATAEAGSELLESPWLSRRELDTARAFRAGAVRGGSVLRVAVIGANGFVGSRLVEQWHLEERVDVVPVVRRPEAAAGALRFGLDCRVADALDEGELTHAFAGCDAVVHAGAGPRPFVTQSPARVVRAAAQAGTRMVST